MGLGARRPQAAVISIAITVVIDVPGFGSIIPARPLAARVPRRAQAVVEAAT